MCFISLARSAPLVVILILIVPSMLALAGAQSAQSEIAQDGLSINGTVFKDLNGDGFLSPGEPGLPGRTIKLLQNGTEQSLATSDSQGRYAFSNLVPGRYVLLEKTPKGWSQTSPGSGEYQINLTDRPAFRLDFGDLSAGKPSRSRVSREHSLMHPGPEDILRWTLQYNRTAKAYLSPEVSQRLAAMPGTSYSLLEWLQYTPSERNQGGCGNCWAWAGTGVMEIDYARRTGELDRFSVQYLNSNYNRGCGESGACCGGWLEDVASFYTGTGKAIPWSNANAQYIDGSASCGGCSEVPASSISTNPSYSIESITTKTIPTQAVGKEMAISNIKNVLLQGKAVWFAYFLPDSDSWSDFMTFWNSKGEEAIWRPDSYCNDQYSFQNGGGHAVLCVGYNDTDPDNRYWIMLNSWGDSTNRPAGLFRVSMDMNYDCSYGNIGYAFYWMTLDITYPDGYNRSPQAPQVPEGPVEGIAGQAGNYSTSAVDENEDTIRYTFDWGDGTSTETPYVSSGSESEAAHSWKSAGTFSVTARATDSRGSESAISPSLVVRIADIANAAPAAPAAPAGARSGITGKAYAFVTRAKDPNRDRVCYTFDWGDGNISKTGFVNSGARGRAVHAWAEPGNFSVRAMATNAGGAQSAWSFAGLINISATASKHPEKAAARKECPCSKRS